MGAKYVSGSMRGAGSVEENRLFSFTRRSICCSTGPTLFTDSCHYLRLMTFCPICQPTPFAETRTTKAHDKEVFEEDLSVAVRAFQTMSVETYMTTICCYKTNVCSWEGKWRTGRQTGTKINLCAEIIIRTPCNLNNIQIVILVVIPK